MPAHCEIRRAADRAVTTTPWLTSRHSFSFGDHYDPQNTHFGLLVVNNDDLVAPASGFDTHSHRDMEIVTWVLDGQLTHQDSAGNRGVIYPGLAQRMSAGNGILHSEKNDSATRPVHFVQMWVVPDETAISPATNNMRSARWAPNLCPSPRAGRAAMPPSFCTTATRRCTARDCAPATASVRPPRPSCTSTYRGAGSPSRAGEIADGDAVRLTETDGLRLTAGEATDLLVWEMHAKLGG